MKRPRVKVSVVLMNENAVRKLTPGENWYMIEAAAYALRAAIDQYAARTATKRDAALEAAIRLVRAPLPDFVRHKERVIEVDRSGDERDRNIQAGDVEWLTST